MGEFEMIKPAYPDDAAITAISEAVIALTLPKAEWTNAAHWAVAIWLIRARPDIMPERDMPDIIRHYNLSVGGENTDSAGYHETITQASLLAARAFLAKRPADEPLHISHAALMTGPLGNKQWALAYWSKERLFSVEARRNWVEPDKGPLPF